MAQMQYLYKTSTLTVNLWASIIWKNVYIYLT